MTQEQQQAILTIALLAAFADGAKDEPEREEIRRIADTLSDIAEAIDLKRLYQDVLLKRVGLEQATAALTETGQRQYAYEMAVCVCEADGRRSDAERRFLGDLKAALGLDDVHSKLIEGEIDTLVGVTEAAVPVSAATGSSGTTMATATTAIAQPAAVELDKSILNYALLNGALELLPQSWASMAIIPLQIRMVYSIGKAHGVELDQGHTKEFIAAAGVGLTSQYLEQLGRKLLGGLLGKMAGKTAGKAGRAATGMTFSFATTYALGQVAKRYYAGGRTMNTNILQETFRDLLGSAKQMQQQYLPQIEQKAATLDASQVMALMRT